MYINGVNQERKIYKIHEYDEYWKKEAPRIQQEFNNDSYDKGCHKCFDTNNHITSGLRQSATEAYLLNHNNFYQTKSPEWLHIKFGNYCNLRCIMCHPDLSSQIHSERLANTEKFQNIGIGLPQFSSLAWWDDPQLLNLVFGLVQNATYVSFSGGEPLLAKQLYEILNHTNKNCIVNINTNLTKLTDQHLLILNRFKYVTFLVSLDGIDKHHEYIRFGSTWSVIENNIHKLLNHKNITVIFTYLLQHTSIYTFPKFYNFIKQFNCELTISTVDDRSVGGNHMMTIDSVPPEDVTKFKNWFSNNPTEYQSIISQWLDMYSFNIEAHNKFKNYILLLDQLRDCDFRATFNPSW